MLADWWAALSGLERVFWGISIVFSVLFFIQFVLSLIGIDFDADTDFDVGGGDVDTGGLDADFTILSVRSFIAFFTFFGWAGVGVINSGGSGLLAAGIGAAAGFSAMFVVAYMMYLFTKLQDEGSVFHIDSAIDAPGKVYLTIPPDQSGKGIVHITVNGTMREMKAMTESTTIPTGTEIRVVDIINDNILLVEPADKDYLLLE